MKKFIFAAAAAMAAMSMSSAAYAIVDDEIDLTNANNDSFSADLVVNPVIFTGSDLLLPTGSYVAKVSGAVTDGVSWRFEDILFDDVSVLDSLIAGGEFIKGTFYFNTPGSHTLKFVGSGSGSFGGSISITAVPEPATWAMMLAGIGAVGFAMRSRKQVSRVSFS